MECHGDDDCNCDVQLGCKYLNKPQAPEFCLKDIQKSLSTIKYGGAANMTFRAKDQKTCLDVCKLSTFRVSRNCERKNILLRHKRYFPNKPWVHFLHVKYLKYFNDFPLKN